jgi:transmembrane sensor
VDFDSTPLADIIEQANRYSPVHIVLGDPGLRATRISGTFRINDPEILAQRLAEILDLETTRTTNEQLVLTRR